jgi:aspartyl-tRNA(Asn)/glutamyl-tRNA(Gln) amidotransferase subunit B
MTDVSNAGAIDQIEATVTAGTAPTTARNWWLNYFARYANDAGTPISALPITGGTVSTVLALVESGSLNDRLARQVFDGVLAGEGTPDEVVAARGLAVVSDDAALGAAVDEAIAADPEVAGKVRAGKVVAVSALVGAVMKATHGQADAQRVRALILTRLGQS